MEKIRIYLKNTLSLFKISILEHHIFQEWLPNSGYKLEHRPHFELLGSKYKNNDPTSEEEVWIPIVKV
ncbi:GyrI-like domain-containing protein [Leptospira noguchii]|uniref:GyrI-like domain-containing protein n=1 Tax=Leptospira noguchii TaxID=28182 RepID=UPI0011472302|nr:GyrI-like domain-containing protein [Leptospira noguchii]